jgi:hypothetical protein
VTEVPQQPPQAGCAAGPAVVVRDDEYALADPGPARGDRECFRARERMPSPSLDAEIR